MNLGNLFTETARLRPHLVALIAGNDKLHYGELNDRTNQVANALAALGIGAGDHVAILIKNDMRFVESFFGPLRLGAIVTAVTTRACSPSALMGQIEVIG